jgi:hypothetical protein
VTKESKREPTQSRRRRGANPSSTSSRKRRPAEEEQDPAQLELAKKQYRNQLLLWVIGPVLFLLFAVSVFVGWIPNPLASSPSAPEGPKGPSSKELWAKAEELFSKSDTLFLEANDLKSEHEQDLQAAREEINDKFDQAEAKIYEAIAKANEVLEKDAEVYRKRGKSEPWIKATQKKSRQIITTWELTITDIQNLRVKNEDDQE